VIRSLLIANRGEIAVRIARTCKRLGIRSIAVYSDADRNAPHVAIADEAFHIGSSPARDSYLRPEAIMEAARRARVEAIHPGYGFLSEKPELPSLCAAAGLVFVGPSSEAIASMGQKIGSKIIAARARVPSIPGYVGDDQSDARLVEEAKRIGFPVMVKASAGGGGRGMRRVFSEAELRPALEIARREAEAAFGDPALLIEKLVLRPRHLEVQIAGDKHGNIVHLFERDCSVQRNNQKLLEEAPAPNLPSSIRAKLLQRAVALGHAISYDNLGTVEFILEEGQDEPWFLEMNTRLQVEHPVTEAITGLDLVEWQIRIASGEPLPLKQDQIRERGHAIEARITAERADQDFRPDVGRISAYREPQTIRVDSGVAEGSEVTLYYDSLMAKAIASGETREESCSRLAAGLRDFVIAGPSSTIPFLIAAVEHPLFAGGRATTRFIEDAFSGGWKAQRAEARIARAAAAFLFATSPRTASEAQAAWQHLAGFRTLAPAGGLAASRVIVQEDQAEHRMTIEALGNDGYRASDADGSFELSLRRAAGTIEIAIDGRLLRAPFQADGPSVSLAIGEERYAFKVTTEIEKASGKGAGSGSGAILSPMPGIVAEVKVAVGDTVEAEQVVAVIESMKLFLPLKTSVAGTVKEVGCSAGQTVQAGARLIQVQPAS
jgi:3-methylcrotonyl-CoA carboxylase alpha subunit